MAAAVAGNQTVEQMGVTVASLTKTVEGLTKALEEQRRRTPAPGTPHPSQVFGLPNARRGANTMGSKGFSFMKMMGVLTGALDPKQAPDEMDVHNRLHQCVYSGCGSSDQYRYSGMGVPGTPGGKFLAPLAPSYFHDAFVDRNFRDEMRELINAGTDGADPHEASWIRTKMLKNQGYGQKTLSWLNELSGGALVAPPEMGELIELLRNKEALVNAGARTVPLPPQGRIRYPRQTMASLTYWVGENFPITESEIGTGDVSLQAKKLAVLIKAPNELLRFASPAAEALIRDDMTKSLALGLDLAGLEGLGGDTRPLGLIYQPGINIVQSSDPRVNGDRIVGNDIYRMIAAIEESNAEMEGFIMRPKTMYKYYQLRSDAVSQGDGQGPFLFNLIREASADFPATLAGFPVTKSTQISQSQSKGTATNLTYITWGMFSELLVGMFGAIEFAATTLGDRSFQNDQTWIRGIISADIALRHAASFGLMMNLDTSL